MKTKVAYDWKDMVIEAKEYFEDFDYEDFREDFLDAYIEELNEEIGLELNKTEYDKLFDEIDEMLLVKKEKRLEEWERQYEEDWGIKGFRGVA